MIKLWSGNKTLSRIVYSFRLLEELCLKKEIVIFFLHSFLKMEINYVSLPT